MITQSLTELRVARAGDTINPEDMTLGLYLFNRLLDQWNANGRAVYAERFDDFTLTASLSPHTIGPTGATWTLAVRPVKLFACQINIGSNTFIPVTVRDAAWYQGQAAPAHTESVPTDVYYRPSWPNGSLYFYGVPPTAYTARLWTETLLAAVAQTDTFTMPPGYQTAIELTLAEDGASSFGQTASVNSIAG